MTQGQSQVKLLTIDKFAQICGTTPRTLRFYEQKGLFKPIKIDKWNNYRYYNPSQVRDFFKIKLLQNFHLPLSEIKISTEVGRKVLLQDKLKALDLEVKEKQKEYHFLQNIDELFEKEFSFSGKLKTENLGPFTLFCVLIEKGEYTKISQYIRKLWEQAKKLGIKCKPPEIVFYLDHIFNPKKAKFEIALICKGRPDFKHLPEGYYFKKFPKTKVYVYKYVGPFQYLSLIYEKFYDYMDQEKIDYRKGGVLEISVRGPLNTKSQYDFLTKIGYYL